MTTLAYIGNSLDAAGWRLAGAHAVAPEPGGEAAALTSVLRVSSVVLLSAAVARALPPDMLEPALTALHPLVLVLPDDHGGPSAAIDPAERVRRQLGLEQDPTDVQHTTTP